LIVNMMRSATFEAVHTYPGVRAFPETDEQLLLAYLLEKLAHTGNYEALSASRSFCRCYQGGMYPFSCGSQGTSMRHQSERYDYQSSASMGCRRALTLGTQYSRVSRSEALYHALRISAYPSRGIDGQYCGDV
jgi:hypothetical protein